MYSIIRCSIIKFDRMKIRIKPWFYMNGHYEGLPLKMDPTINTTVYCCHFPLPLRNDLLTWIRTEWQALKFSVKAFSPLTPFAIWNCYEHCPCPCSGKERHYWNPKNRAGKTSESCFGNGYLFIYLFTYLLTLLTPWRRVLKKLTSFQLFKKIPAFHGTRRFIIAFTSARYLSLSRAS